MLCYFEKRMEKVITDGGEVLGYGSSYMMPVGIFIGLWKTLYCNSYGLMMDRNELILMNFVTLRT